MDMIYEVEKHKRGQAKRIMKKVYLEEAHTARCQVIPTRERMLDLIPKDGVAGEVGVAFGDFTAEILARIKPRKLHLVDLWGLERYSDGLKQINERFEPQIASGLVEVNRGMSVDVLAQMPDAYFDWLYIDTDHSYNTTLAELKLAARKVKSGGSIAGHDFCTGNVIGWVPYGVIEACNEFCVEDGWQYRFLTLEPHGHLSFGLERL